MPRFIPTRSGAGIPAILDTENKRLVGTLFTDRTRPGTVETMLNVCCDALNAASQKRPVQPVVKQGTL